MWRINKLLLFYIKVLNFTFFEITIFQRFQLFINHILNSFSNNKKIIKVKQINIENIYVISLLYRYDRREKIKKSFNEINLMFNFFDAYYIDINHDLNQYFTNKSIKYLSHGSLSCALSHLKLLESIASFNSNNYYIIFEDDIIFCENFTSKLNSLINNFPIDADMFYLGTRNERNRDFIFKCNYGYYKSYNLRLGAYAYILNSSTARKIINCIKPINLYCGGIDTAIGKLIRNRKLNVYQFEKSIIMHDNNSLSNIYNPLSKFKLIHAKTNSKWPFKNE